MTGKFERYGITAGKLNGDQISLTVAEPPTPFASCGGNAIAGGNLPDEVIEPT